MTETELETDERCKRAAATQPSWEEQRKPTNGDLHDELANLLTAIKVDITRALESPSGAVQLAKTSELVDAAIGVLRRILADPKVGVPDDLGLLD